VARGKIALAQHLLKDDIALDDQTYLAMSKCLLCGSCVEKCPNEAPTDEIVIAAREALAEKRGLTTFHKAVAQVIQSRTRMKLGAKAAGLLGPLFFKKCRKTQACGCVFRSLLWAPGATYRPLPELPLWSAILKSWKVSRASRVSCFCGVHD